MQAKRQGPEILELDDFQDINDSQSHENAAFDDENNEDKKLNILYSK